MAPIIAALLAGGSALEKAYAIVHNNMGTIAPVVLMIEKAAEGSSISGVQKAAVAAEALQAQIPEFANMTPEIKTAFNAAVTVIKRIEAALSALKSAVTGGHTAT
jgi:hypothetical protein